MMSAAIESREDFLADRNDYLGCSDLAAAIGIDPYRTPLDLYNEKVGLVERFAGNRHTERGLWHEQTAAMLYTNLTGQKLRRRNQALVHSEHGFIRGHIDRVVEGEKTIAEIKCPSLANYRKIQREGLPDSWIAQLQGYLALAKYPKGVWLIYCADQHDLLHFEIEADPALQEQLIGQAAKFWIDHIVARVPPTAGKSDSDAFEFQKIGGDITKRDDPQFVEAAQLLREAYTLKSESDELMAMAKERIKQVVEKQLGRYEGGGLRLSYYQSQGHLSFDKKGLAAAHPEINLTDFERRGSPFEVLKPFFIGTGDE